MLFCNKECVFNENKKLNLHFLFRERQIALYLILPIEWRSFSAAAFPIRYKAVVFPRPSQCLFAKLFARYQCKSSADVLFCYYRKSLCNVLSNASFKIVEKGISLDPFSKGIFQTFKQGEYLVSSGLKPY